MCGLIPCYGSYMHGRSFGREVNEMELSFCIALLCYGLGAMLRVDRLVKSRLTAVLTWVWKNEACIHIAACAQKIQFWIKSRFKAYSTLGHTSLRGVKEG